MEATSTHHLTRAQGAECLAAPIRFEDIACDLSVKAVLHKHGEYLDEFERQRISTIRIRRVEESC